jgi:hypothetical protein
MEKIRHKLINALFGVSGGLTGLIFISGCSGRACPSCIGCAGAGAGILLLMLWNKIRPLRGNAADLTGRVFIQREQDR